MATIDDLVAGVAALTTAAQSLTDAVNVSKTTLDQKVSTATGQAAAAGVSAASANAANGSAQALLGGIGNITAALAIMLGYANTATAQQGLAYSYAMQATSVVQQDTSGVINGALHRSPNTIVAREIYDTRLDPDGGAWRKRVANFGYLTEQLNGQYLPNVTVNGFQSEIEARDYLGALGGTSVLTGSDSKFANGIGSWAGANANSQCSWVNGRLRLTQIAGSGYVAGSTPFTTVVGQRYRVEVNTATSPTNGTNSFAGVGTAPGGTTLGNLNMLTAAGGALGAKAFSFVATGTTSYVTVFNASNWAVGTYMEFNSITITPIDYAKTNASGAFYPLATDGKHYRLYTNLLRSTQDITAANWLLNNASGAATRSSSGAVTFGANATDQIYQSGTGSSIPVGVPMTGAVKLSGTGTVRFNVYDGNGSAPAGPSTITLTSTPTWYVINYVTANAGANGGVFVYNNAAGTATSFTLHSAQTQFGTVAANAIVEEAKGSDSSQVETTRGNTPEFPAVAGIVAEAASVTIYDLLAKGQPMWMRIARGTSTSWWSNNNGNSVTSVAAFNGLLVIGRTNFGGLEINFAKNTGLNRYTGGDSNNLIGGVENRNATGATNGPAQVGLAGIINSTVSHVAITVLPDAPIDPVTLLPVPTIGYGTSAGATVIKDDGTAVHSSNVNPITRVAFWRNQLLLSYFGHQANAGPVRSLVASFPNASYALVNADAAPTYGGITLPSPLGGNFNPVNMTPTGQALSKGLMVFRRADTIGNMAVGAITPYYSTGWLIGNTVRCVLSDTTVGTVGAEQVANGDNEAALYGGKTDGIGMQRGVVNWSTDRAHSGTRSAKYTCNDATAGDHLPNILTVPAGMAVDVSLWVYNPTGNFPTLRLVDQSDGSWSSTSTPTKDGWVQITAQRNAKGSAWALSVGSLDGAVSGNGFVFYYDDISVREIVSDRSYKTRPMSAIGSVVRTPVGVGGQLVAFSNFSSVNYLQEAYSSDLDFGTGGFAIAPWVSVPGTLGAVFPQGADQRATGAINMLGTTTAATYNTATGDGSVTRTDLNNQSAVIFSGLTAKTVWMTGTNGAGPLLLRSGGYGGSAVVIDPGATFAVRVAVQGGLIYVAASSGTATFTGLTIKQESPVYAVDRSAATGAYWRLGLNADGTLQGEVYDGTTTRTVTTTTSFAGASFIAPILQLEPSGSLTLKVNGIKAGQTTGAPLLTLNNASAVFTVGALRDGSGAFPGSISLVRVASTVPTPDAALANYDDERHMFRDGAQVTLPDANSVVDYDHDEGTNKRVVVSGFYEAAFVGFVRASAAPAASGFFNKITARSGFRMVSRNSANPGVDVTVPSRALMEDLNRKAEDAARIVIGAVKAIADWQGAFTANVSNNSALITVTSSSLQLPPNATLIGAAVSGTGIQAGTTVLDVVGTQVQLSKPATATGAAVTISMQDLILPPGYAAHIVCTAGSGIQEGTGKPWQRTWDGIREGVHYTSVPGNQWLQVEMKRG